MHLALAFPLAFIGGLGHWELLVILIIALLIFGSRLPKVMRSMGQSVTEFKRGMNEMTTDVPPPTPAPAPAPTGEPTGQSSEQPTGEPTGGDNAAV